MYGIACGIDSSVSSIISISSDFSEIISSGFDSSSFSSGFVSIVISGFDSSEIYT